VQVGFLSNVRPISLLAFAGIIIVAGLGLLGALMGRRKVGNPWISIGFLYFLLKRKVLRMLGVWEQEERYYREIYVNQNVDEVKVDEACREGLVVLGVIVGFFLLILGFSQAGRFEPTKVEELSRPENGAKAESLLADYDGERYEISVSVTERKMTADEVKKAWSQAKEHLPEWILGENAALNCITKDLELITRLPGTGVKIAWYSSNYKVVGYDGTVDFSKLGGESEEVTLVARLTYGDWGEEIQIPVVVCAGGGASDVYYEAVKEALRDTVSGQVYEEMISLPTEVTGEAVTFYREQAQSPWIFVALLFLALIALLMGSLEGKKKQLQKRREQMHRDYPEIVSKMTLLMEAGMTIRGAWERVIRDYERFGRREGAHFAYEEMIQTMNRLQVGAPEDVAYADYGKRCGTIRYLRFSSVLVQNLRKGTKSVIPILKKEAEEARLERKEQARKLGEEAGTKLLLPMGGMLVVVLVIVLTPAFMSL